MMTRRTTDISIFFAFAALTVLPASADPITMIHQSNGSGSIGQLTFTNADFTITTQADTDDIVQLGTYGWAIAHTTATINITGVGTFDFITNTRTFANDFNNSVGFSQVGGLDLLNGPINNINLSNWDMTTSIGPVTGSAAFYDSWGTANILTTGGTLFFETNVTSATATFSATVVPTPTALSLFTLSALTTTRRRRHN